MLKLPEIINLQCLRRYHELPSRAKARPRPSAAPLTGIPGLTVVGHLGGQEQVGKLSDWYVKSSKSGKLIRKLGFDMISIYSAYSKDGGSTGHYFW